LPFLLKRGISLHLLYFEKPTKMKKLILIALIAFVTNAKAQITLEATYDSASTNLYIVNLEIDGDKYIKLQQGDSGKRFIYLYNLNHSLWKTIDCNSFPKFDSIPGGGAVSYGRYMYSALYVTQSLFNSDPLVEFMFVPNSNGDANSYFTGIYNENGVAIFTQDSAGPYLSANIPQVAKPIYNTSAGTKMILSFPGIGKAKVYSIPGTVPTTDQWLHKAPTSAFNAYPNPSSSHTNIDYKLPQGVQTAEIIIQDLNGKELRRYKVDNTFNNIILSNSDLSNGTYLYSLQANGTILETKKIIIAN